MTDTTTHTRVSPSTKPAVILIALTTVTMIAVALAINAARADLGRQATNILTIVTVLFGAIVIFRALVEIFILKRTNYIITNKQLRREFKMFYRVREREIPLNELRGIELDRSVLQSLLGYGDLRFLTGGTNQSLGFVKFERIENPEAHRDSLRDLLNYGDDVSDE